MPSIPQITQVDPASMPDSKLDIGLPIISSVYGSAFNTGFSFGDIFNLQNNGSFTPNMDFILDSKKMRDNNFFILNGSTDLLFLGFKKNSNFYSFNITEKFDFTFNYPRDLVVMALEGNGNNLLGKRASFDGLGIDFTARDIQNKLKDKGHPWEKSKAFDNSCMVGDFINVEEIENISNINFELKKNSSIVQSGNSSNMLWKIDEIISYVSQYFTLKIGDLIFTGTPSGVSKVISGDFLEGFINSKKMFSLKIK